jgi:hypothetical protein
MSVIFPWCDECKNLIPIDDKYCCKAFPDEIPSYILFDTDIKNKLECNNGYKFEE